MTFLALLLGAGITPAPQSTVVLRHLIRKAHRYADSLSLSSAQELAVEVAAFLEDDPLTNAGTGSELTYENEVECDATLVLCPPFRTAAVGAVPDVRNPVKLCAALLKDVTKSSALAAPNIMCGVGAKKWAKQKGLEISNLITDRALKRREKYGVYTDTIGVIVITDTEIAVCSSSGGLLLKPSGRVGPAGIPGAAAWTDGKSAAVCSGFGEDITTIRLAEYVCQNSPPVASKIPKRIALQRPLCFGYIRVQLEENSVLVEWENTAPSMVCSAAQIGFIPHVITPREPSQGGVRLQLR